MAEIILANLSDINGFATNTVAVAGTSYAASSQGIFLVTASGAFAFTLPSGANVTTGAFAIVKDAGGNAATYNITVSPASGTIDGAGSFKILQNYGELWFAYNGSAWTLFGRYAPEPRLVASGNATLVGGTVDVTFAGITANSLISLTRKTVGGTPGFLSYTITVGSKFNITSASGTDTSTLTYLVYEP